MAGLTKRRVARKQRRCASCNAWIRVRDVYLEHTLFPGNDIFDNRVPIRSAECSECAGRYGRGALVA